MTYVVPPGALRPRATALVKARCAAAAILASFVAVAADAQDTRPQPVRFTTEAVFDAGSVAPYAGRHEDVYKHIDANLAEHIAHLQRWVRQPSVSAQKRGITEMAGMLAGDLRALGFKEVEIVPTAGHPGVFGFYDAGAPRTLLVYMMYDVQPEETGWKVPAFDGALVETDLGRVLMARGATNQKGPERAFLNALDSIIKTRGRLPVNLLVAAEGEEELGSPHYPEVIAKYEAAAEEGRRRLLPVQLAGRQRRCLAPARREGHRCRRARSCRRPAGRPGKRRDPQLAQGHRRCARMAADTGARVADERRRQHDHGARVLLTPFVLQTKKSSAS